MWVRQASILHFPRSRLSDWCSGKMPTRALNFLLSIADASITEVLPSEHVDDVGCRPASKADVRPEEVISRRDKGRDSGRKHFGALSSILT